MSSYTVSSLSNFGLTSFCDPSFSLLFSSSSSSSFSSKHIENLNVEMSLVFILQTNKETNLHLFHRYNRKPFSMFVVIEEFDVTLHPNQFHRFVDFLSFWLNVFLIAFLVHPRDRRCWTKCLETQKFVVELSFKKHGYSIDYLTELPASRKWRQKFVTWTWRCGHWWSRRTD